MADLQWKLESLEYRDFASYRFTDEQRIAYRLVVEIEIISIIKSDYLSFKSVPPNGFYGHAVVFHGVAPYERIPLEFSRQRVYDVERPTPMLMSYIFDTGVELLLSLGQLATFLGADVSFDQPAEYPAVSANPASVIKVWCPPGTQFRFLVSWATMPQSSRTPIPQEVGIPLETGDEFPSPANNPRDDPWFGNNDPDFSNPLSDPRDYSPENLQGVVRVVAVRMRYVNTPTNDDYEVTRDLPIPALPGTGSLSQEFEGGSVGMAFTYSYDSDNGPQEYVVLTRGGETSTGTLLEEIEGLVGVPFPQ